ncbi:hypothetical protein EAF00_003415 [Botryotinia globosa]|nr:hypothetical protein EAF00_003415 [Botryotinia globosa]
MPRIMGRMLEAFQMHAYTDKKITITETPIGELFTSIATGKLIPLAVTKAILRRAAVAQKLINVMLSGCVYELLPERAVSRAKELDEHFAEIGPIGPFHGLPTSVKEHIGMKDLDNTCGLVGWVGRKHHDDANILQILLATGAVLYVRTSEPQALAPGGSSGGESAFRALGGNLLVIRSEVVCGSIRSPAVQCGLYGLRPTTFRLPLVGLAAPSMGCDTIAGTIGSLNRSLEGIDIFMKVALHSKPWVSDPCLHQKPWITGQTSTDRLTVGLMIAYHEDSSKLESPITKVVTKLYECDGGELFADTLALSGEPGLPLTNYTLKDSSGVQNLTHQEA